MELEFTEIRRGDANRYSWSPFDDSDNFPTFDWWDHVPYLNDDPWFVRVTWNGIEVGRIELDDEVELSHYGLDRDVQAHALEIQFIEVAASHRRRGVGREIVQSLALQYPSRTLLALSEDADEFWGALGWRRYDHPTEAQFFRPLFVQQR